MGEQLSKKETLVKLLAIFLVMTQLLIMPLFAGEEVAIIKGMRTPIYYASAEQLEGELLFVRDAATHNQVVIHLTKNTGEVIHGKVGRQNATFSKLSKKDLILDFSKAEKLSGEETQAVRIHFDHKISFSNDSGLKVQSVNLEDFRAPHQVKVKTWFLDEDVEAKIVISEE